MFTVVVLECQSCCVECQSIPLSPVMANKKNPTASANPATSANAAPPVPPKSGKANLGRFPRLSAVKPISFHSGNPAFVKYYLLAYNILSTLAWGYILVLTVIHLFNLDGRSSTIRPLAAAPSAFSRFMSSIPFFRSTTPSVAATIDSRLPPFLQPIYRRSTTTYTRIGNTVAVVQTCALLELVHVLLGWVRSGLQTTAMQVGSRLWIVWGIAQQFGVVSPSRALS